MTGDRNKDWDLTWVYRVCVCVEELLTSVFPPPHTPTFPSCPQNGLWWYALWIVQAQNCDWYSPQGLYQSQPLHSLSQTITGCGSVNWPWIPPRGLPVSTTVSQIFLPHICCSFWPRRLLLGAQFGPPVCLSVWYNLSITSSYHKAEITRAGVGWRLPNRRVGSALAKLAIPYNCVNWHNTLFTNLHL